MIGTSEILSSNYFLDLVVFSIELRQIRTQDNDWNIGNSSKFELFSGLSHFLDQTETNSNLGEFPTFRSRKRPSPGNNSNLDNDRNIGNSSKFELFSGLSHFLDRTETNFQHSDRENE